MCINPIEGVIKYFYNVFYFLKDTLHILIMIWCNEGLILTLVVRIDVIHLSILSIVLVQLLYYLYIGHTRTIRCSGQYLEYLLDLSICLYFESDAIIFS